jgi:ATP-dependent Clp protease ATP-binding subunit ClpA
VLDRSLREAVSRHHEVDTEHILLGLASEPEGIAARVLAGFGADPGTVRAEVERRLRGAPGGSIG